MDGKQVLIVVTQVLTQLITQVGIGIPVAHNLHGLRTADTAVIGGDDDLAILLCQLTEEFGDDRMAEPGERDRTVGTLIVGELAHHPRLRTGVTQHIDEVEHYDVQIVLPEVRHLLHQLVGIGRVVHLVIREGVLLAIAVQLRLNERCLVQVLAFLLVFIHPEVGKHLGNLVGHQT